MLERLMFSAQMFFLPMHGVRGRRACNDVHELTRRNLTTVLSRYPELFGLVRMFEAMIRIDRERSMKCVAYHSLIVSRLRHHRLLCLAVNLGRRVK